MAFIAYIGKMGSGKTYSIAELILTALANGRPVITNVPLNIHDCPNLYKWDWDYINLDLKRESKGFKDNKYGYPNGGVLFVLDEVWEALGVEAKCSKNTWLMSFFREHRQFLDDNGISNDIVLCTQDIESVNASLRRLFDETVLCVKPTQLGFKGSSVRYYIQGAWKGLDVPTGRSAKSKIVKSDQIFFKPEIYNMYKSHKYAPDGVTGGYDKEGTVSNHNIFQSFKFKFFVVFIVIMAVLFYKSVSHLTSDDNKLLGDKNDKKTKVVSDNLSNNDNADNNNKNGNESLDRKADSRREKTSNNNVDVKQLPNNNENIILSGNWRLASVMQNKRNGEWFIHIVNATGNIKRIPSSKCTHDEFGQVECTVDNEIITKYSGTQSSTSVGLQSVFASNK